MAHPGGPLTTNKAAALAKFLERKLQEPNGLASINPDLLELAVKNAKDTVLASNFPQSFSTAKFQLFCTFTVNSALYIWYFIFDSNIYIYGILAIPLFYSGIRQAFS